jgi:prophage regulatory protein
VTRFLSKKQVKAICLYSFQHTKRLEDAGKFPKRVRLGNGRVGYVEDEIEAWCKARIEERNKSDEAAP